MDEEYWKDKWKDTTDCKPNPFAKKAYKIIYSRYLIIKEKQPITLLDLGCGDGRDSLYFAKKGFDITAMDFSESGINRLNQIITNKKINNIRPLIKDIKEINFQENSFGVIYAHLSLHFFDNEMTLQIFDKLYHCIKPKGMIFVKCKSIEDPLFEKGIKVGENMYIEEHLRHFFDKEFMKNNLKKFNILKIKKSSSKYHNYNSNFIEAIAIK